MPEVIDISPSSVDSSLCFIQPGVHGVLAHSAQLLSCLQRFATPWAVAYQTSPSMGFSRQEYWSGLPFSSPGDLPHPGIKPRSPTLQTDTLPSEPPGKPSWQINGEVMEIMRDFISLGSKITADGDCSHEIKRRLLLGRKAVTNLDSTLKSRVITLPT